MEKFEKELTSLINKHSLENDSNTHDFVSAKYLVDCLEAYNKAVSKRAELTKKGRK